MERRVFLQRLGLATTAPLVAACARTFSIPPEVMATPEGGPPARNDPDGIWREAAAYARWAPSPHNVQPWLLRVTSPTHAELLYTPDRLLPKTDPTSAFSIMGLTMFADFLSIAVAPRGYAITAAHIAKPLDYTATKPQLFANLELISNAQSRPALDRELILKRQTSRLQYDGHPVHDDVLSALSSIATGHGHTFQSSSDDDLVDWMIDLNRFTLFDDLDRTPERTELRRWIRTSDQEAAEKKDGLWSECLQFPGWILKDFFDDHEKWGHGWRASICGRALVAGMKGTRTVAWWSGPFAEPHDWIAAGQVLGRSWLELADRGVQLHPFGSIITNPSAHARLVEKLGKAPGDNPLWLLVRMGRSKTPPRAYRLDEPAIFLNDTTAG